MEVFVKMAIRETSSHCCRRMSVSLRLILIVETMMEARNSYPRQCRWPVTHLSRCPDFSPRPFPRPSYLCMSPSSRPYLGLNLRPFLQPRLLPLGAEHGCLKSGPSHVLGFHPLQYPIPCPDPHPVPLPTLILSLLRPPLSLPPLLD
ncbi:hypothetical protein GYMLUDRAFT_584136 [Collybiopsis luxurians FD-317 M1]|uniref:Uncharacterized protein n=1 Tax=Collybiopsis luxurians FD-317 M1 TaxID=944289 RepID=A0A0D0BZW2_9AGAR|nr:hypothetical protein GYMLUDRAFT_584136 [Collybiopsis luxurians FD-317 M1]